MRRSQLGGGDAELHAFVDGQLDLAGRLDVQARLAADPEIASQVAADMRLNDELRLLAAEMVPAARSGATLEAAERLQSALAYDRRRRPLQQLAAAAAIFALGWGASLGWMEMRSETAARPDPATIESDFGPTLMTASTPDRQLDFLPATLGRVLGVSMPEIPSGWQIVNSDIVWHAGQAAANLIFQTADYGRLALTVWRTGDVGIMLPEFSQSSENASAHWQIVTDNYALRSDEGRSLETAALKLFQTLY